MTGCDGFKSRRMTIRPPAARRAATAARSTLTDFMEEWRMLTRDVAEETETAERTSMMKCRNKQRSGEGEAGEGEQVRVRAHEATSSKSTRQGDIFEAHEATSCAKITRDGATERGATSEEGESMAKSAI